METVCGRRVLGSTRLLRAFAEHSALPLGARLCYLLMCAYGRDSGECYTSAATLARVLHTSRRAVKRYWHLLRQAGWISSRRVPGKVSHHVFPWHPKFAEASPVGGDRTVPTLGTKPAPGGDRAVTQMERTYVREEKSSSATTKLHSEVRAEIWGYFQGERRIQVDPPDNDIVRQCVQALRGHTIEELRAVLRGLFRTGHRPGQSGGPRSYAWFPRVIQNTFGPRE